MIRLESISKTFQTKSGAVTAVDDVTLEMQQGEIFGIIGFSGAGKSTLVRCMNLLERPTKGKVIIAGKDLMELESKELRKIRRKIGMIFQHFNLMSSRTVYQNIAFPLRKSSLSKIEKEEKIRSLLQLVDLVDKKDAYPSQLSGGQKQRVAIARALANDPDVLLCDEATSALDPQTTKSILKLLKKVNQELNITVVLITHEMAVVKEICDRVAIMEKGRVVEYGDTVQLFAYPKQKITKDFIHTAGNLEKVQELLEEEHELLQLEDGSKLLLLTYSGENAGHPLISCLVKKFDIEVNILYGNIDFLKGKPLGKLVISLAGTKEHIEEAMEYIRAIGVEMEVMRG